MAADADARVLNWVPEDTYWNVFHVRWSDLRPPLRPDSSVCDRVRSLIAGHDSRVLLLGATPELTALALQIVAVDWSANTIASIWPGNTPTRRAVRGNWLELPCASASLSAAIGDGSLNCLDYPSQYRRVFAHLARVLRPGGRIAVRMYLTPPHCESVAAACAAAAAGRVGSIHALKWRIANAVAAQQQTPNVAVRTIVDVFNRELPDRDALRHAPGWTLDEIAQIDAWDGQPDVFSFPTAAQVSEVANEHFQSVRFVDTGNYELAERCPILVMDLAQ